MAETFEYGLNSSAISFDGENKYLRITDIDDSSNLFKQDSLTSPDADLKNSDSYLLRKGDILFARTGASVGKTYRYQEEDGKVYYAGFLIRARINSLFDSEFIFQNTLTNNYNNFVKVVSQRSGQPGINAKEYRDFELHVPNLYEQQKIGKFFKSLDDVIALHQRKLDLLKSMKQAFLQEMFPKKGTDVPRVRFANFSDVWEQCKLGEITESFDGQRVPIDSGFRVSGQYPYYGATGIIDYVDDYIFDGEYVLLAEDGANIIMRNYPVAYLTQGKFWLNNHAHIMKMIDGSNQFLVQNLEKIDYIKYNTGTAQPKLNSKAVKNIELRVPTSKEQQKIGAFFEQLDNTITLHQLKIDKLNRLKQAYLQNLFL